ncbi:MAG: phosphate ABC transporter substrate-binding protein PstS [Nocardioidaceae bacterium]|nr:phosphate ABC transporter substrate-binding protein PstS [Nocardioidaceae bacterium]
MKLNTRRRAALPGIAALALAVSACSSGDTDGSADLSGNLTIGGASSQESAQNAWIVGFSESAPEVQVNYDAIGSGGGRENFADGSFPLAGTDSYLSEDEFDKAKQTCGGDPIELPAYVSPIAIIYNLPGVEDLRISPEALAAIFAGTITKWNDPAIAKTNDGVSLPSAPITAVHRSDESGTTENFTDYLAAVAPEEWTHDAVELWPEAIQGGDAGKGTSGVVDTVTRNENSIAYADASQAGGLGQAKVGVGDEFVGPSAEAAAQILAVSPRVKGRTEVDMAVDLDHATQEAGVYPIVLTSYLLACQEYEAADTAAMVKAYLEYIVSDEGQKFAAEEAGSAPLASELQEEAQQIVAKIGAS